jgi:hypothetical protein
LIKTLPPLPSPTSPLISSSPIISLEINSPADLQYQLLDLAPRLYDLEVESLRVLNLGAGNGEGTFSQNIQSIPFGLLTNVEIYPDALFQLSQYHFAAHNVDYVNSDMVEYVRTLRDKSYDCAILIDTIEHITRERAWELLGELKRVCTKRIILFLPFGDCPQDEYGNNPFQHHKSSWSPEDFDLPDTQVEVMWRHWHVQNAPYAGFVTFFLS